MTQRHFPGNRTVAIVGGGVSGLAAGCLLAQNGFRVRLFEANGKVGGCCATTTIDGYTFNDGAIYVAVVKVLDHGFEKLGLDRAALLPLRRITPSFAATLPDGTVVMLGEGHDVSVEGRHVDRARLQGDLRRLLDRWGPLLDLVNDEIATRPLSPWRILQKGWRHLHKLRGTVASELGRLITDEAVRGALSGALLYSGVPPERMPVFALIGLVAMMTEGFYLPEGGMGRIPETLASAFQRLGGEVFLDSPVEKIIIELGADNDDAGPGSSRRQRDRDVPSRTRGPARRGLGRRAKTGSHRIGHPNPASDPRSRHRGREGENSKELSGRLASVPWSVVRSVTDRRAPGVLRSSFPHPGALPGRSIHISRVRHRAIRDVGDLRRRGADGRQAG